MKFPSSLPAALFAASVLSGCATGRMVQPAIPGNLQHPPGRVLVVAGTNAPRLAIDVPPDRTEIMADKPTMGWIPPRKIIASAPSGIVQGLVAIPGGPAAAAALAIATPVGLLLATPLAHEFYRGYALAAAGSEATISASRTQLDAATQGLALEELLRDRVETELAAAPGGIAVASNRTVADTVLELMLFEPKIAGGEGPNPGLRLRFGLRVRLLEAATGRELHYDYIEYRGAAHRFVEWADNDARVLHEEIGRCLAGLAREVTARLSGTPSRRESLAAEGITHRAELSANRPINPMLVPPRTRYRYTD
jgi:hypothetical protein